MSWDYNLYYSPEKCGLKIIGSIEKEPDYDFHMLVVWEDEKGNLFMAVDSGCSCPSPFEEIRGVEDLERIGSYEQFSRAVNSFRDSLYGQPLAGGSASVDSLRRKVQRRLTRV